MKIQIHLTEDTAEFGARLRRTFMSGERAGRYRPQPKTPFNALIADCDLNQLYVNLDRAFQQPQVTTHSFPLTINSETHRCLEKFGEALGKAIPDRDKDEHRRLLEAIVEKVVQIYNPEEKWLKTRRIVKKHVVKEGFKKSDDHVAFDVPLQVWGKFDRLESLPEDAVLEAMDAHIKNICAVGEYKMRFLLENMKAKIAAAKVLVTTSEVRFSVLNLGAEAKTVLNSAISGDFEPYLVALLIEDPPKSPARK